MIKKYLVNYFDKIKDTKKVARDKNVGVWWLPVFDSFLITIYLSWQLSVGVWILLDAWQSGQDYVPWYMDTLWEVSSFSLTIFMSIITFTILDKIILFFIYFHSYANKLVLRGIGKLDMYLWRKTGRDTVVTNAIVIIFLSLLERLMYFLCNFHIALVTTVSRPVFLHRYMSSLVIPCNTSLFACE